MTDNPEILRVLYSLDAKLSLLRHRCERQIPWGTAAAPALHDVDQAIGDARRIEAELERLPRSLDS
jgi:hypothetical protein